MPRRAAETRVEMPGPSAPLASTALLKRYRPLETRAQGGFGSVEVCLDTRLMRRVAIKRIPLASPFTRTSEATVAEALAEARTASMLSHPNIVPVIDFTFDATYAYLVMEYVDGMSLAEFLAQVDGSSLTYDETAAVAEALCSALSFAHENGVLHLDIKPANVLIDRKGHIRLTDFGMATLASAAGFGGARGGTVGYMPPEQIEGGTVDERSDVFSLATVLYESLCATSPFAAATAQDSLKRIERGVLYPSDLLPTVPSGTEAALLAALDPSPDGRPADVAAFADLFLDGLGDARRGRKSLAQIIAKLTSDEADADADAAEQDEAPAWEFDPARGHIGSRFSRAPRIALAATTAIVTFALSSTVLSGLGVEDVPARVAASLAIAAASGLAPQVGSALVLAGTLAAMLAGGPLSIVLLPVAVLFVTGGTWWFIWGRLDAACSAAMLGIAAGGALAGSPLALAGPVCAAAAVALPPSRAAPRGGVGGLFPNLFLGAVRAHFALGPGQFAMLFADPLVWLQAAVLAAVAAAASALVRKGAGKAVQGRGKALLAGGIVLVGAAVATVSALANPMEIDVTGTALLASAAGLGCASSIIGWILILAFGYPDGTSGR